LRASASGISGTPNYSSVNGNVDESGRRLCGQWDILAEPLVAIEHGKGGDKSRITQQDACADDEHVGKYAYAGQEEERGRTRGDVRGHSEEQGNCGQRKENQQAYQLRRLHNRINHQQHQEDAALGIAGKAGAALESVPRGQILRNACRVCQREAQHDEH